MYQARSFICDGSIVATVFYPSSSAKLRFYTHRFPLQAFINANRRIRLIAFFAKQGGDHAQSRNDHSSALALALALSSLPVIGRYARASDGASDKED